VAIVPLAGGCTALAILAAGGSLSELLVATGASHLGSGFELRRIDLRELWDTSLCFLGSLGSQSARMEPYARFRVFVVGGLLCWGAVAPEETWPQKELRSEAERREGFMVTLMMEGRSMSMANGFLKAEAFQTRWWSQSPGVQIGMRLRNWGE
jgi:hypothetical protein